MIAKFYHNSSKLSKVKCTWKNIKWQRMTPKLADTKKRQSVMVVEGDIVRFYSLHLTAQPFPAHLM